MKYKKISLIMLTMIGHLSLLINCQQSDGEPTHNPKEDVEVMSEGDHDSSSSGNNKGSVEDEETKKEAAAVLRKASELLTRFEEDSRFTDLHKENETLLKSPSRSKPYSEGLRNMVSSKEFHQTVLEEFLKVLTELNALPFPDIKKFSKAFKNEPSNPSLELVKTLKGDKQESGQELIDALRRIIDDEPIHTDENIALARALRVGLIISEAKAEAK